MATPPPAARRHDEIDLVGEDLDGADLAVGQAAVDLEGVVGGGAADGDEAVDAGPKIAAGALGDAHAAVEHEVAVDDDQVVERPAGDGGHGAGLAQLELQA